jgi:hypothetical protein
MGKPTGFIDYEREDAKAIEPKERIKNFKEFHIPLSMEKQQVQGARCMNCGVPFCQSGMTIMGMTSGCPLHNLVPEWNDLVYTGNWEQAYNRLKKTNNFPEFTSRVCPALCEAACTCGHWEDPVTCKANEHGIIENAYEKGYAAAKPPRVRTGKKVAIIGSGPAGLAAADQLNKRGHQVTVFERDDRVGGLLMYGIPNMKLEKWVIDRKVDIQERIVSRFKWGLSAEVKSPDFDTRKKIIVDKLHRDGIVLKDDMVDFLAGEVKSNVRELIGVINSVIAHSMISKSDLSLDLLKETINKIAANQKKTINIPYIQEVVCEYFGIQREQLLSKTRKREIALPRQLAMYFAKEYTNATFTKIGEEMGGKDHSTVMYACETIRDVSKIDKELKKYLKEIKDKIFE